MEYFQNAYVLLQSTVHGKYIHASEDGRSVHLAAAAPQVSRNAVWAVERDHIEDKDYVFLRGVYGRYLGAPNLWSTCVAFPQVAAMQHDRDKRQMKEIMWQASESRDGCELTCALGSYLRTGFYISGCHSVKDWNMGSKEWTVHPLGQNSNIPRSPDSCVGKRRCCFKREIRWVLAEESGRIQEDSWGKIWFVGRDMKELEKQLKTAMHDFPMSLFFKAGSHGTPTPLCVNLPCSQEPISIVALWGTPAIDQLRFPNIDIGVLSDQAAGDIEISRRHYSIRR